jgi:hypothetical protein
MGADLPGLVMESKPGGKQTLSPLGVQVKVVEVTTVSGFT